MIPSLAPIGEHVGEVVGVGRPDEARADLAGQHVLKVAVAVHHRLRDCTQEATRQEPPPVLAIACVHTATACMRTATACMHTHGRTKDGIAQQTATHCRRTAGAAAPQRSSG